MGGYSTSLIVAAVGPGRGYNTPYNSSDPLWAHVVGQIAGTLLLLELITILLTICALTTALAVAAWWVHAHFRPLMDIVSGRTIEALGVANSGSVRVVRGIAEFYGRRQQVETALKVFLLGRAAPRTSTVPSDVAVDEARHEARVRGRTRAPKILPGTFTQHETPGLPVERSTTRPPELAGTGSDLRRTGTSGMATPGSTPPTSNVDVRTEQNGHLNGHIEHDGHARTSPHPRGE